MDSDGDRTRAIVNDKTTAFPSAQVMEAKEAKKVARPQRKLEGRDRCAVMVSQYKVGEEGKLRGEAMAEGQEDAWRHGSDAYGEAGKETSGDPQAENK
ncbi:hypothetical protein HOY80DRAFT_953152 [Tuber brumale]|nr:hypothetical protein HOY80DRAFT_953152 [Tuber brumale]